MVSSSRPAGQPVASTISQPKSARSVGTHLLQRHTVDVGKYGAQRFVATHHIGQRRAQRVSIKAPAQLQSHRQL